MKKGERKILEKKIIDGVTEIIVKYDSKAAAKVKKTVKENAKDISKKFYKIARTSTKNLQPKKAAAKLAKKK